MSGDAIAGQGPLATAPTLARIERLHRDRHERDTQQCFFVEGVRNFVQAVEHGYAIDTLVYSDRLLTAPVARMFVRRLKRAGTPFVNLSPTQFRQVSHAERASGVGAILHQRIEPLPPVVPRTDLCWVALGEVRSSGNFGSLIRTAAAVGAAGFILLDGRVDPFDPTVVRASMGTFYRQRFVRTDATRLHHWALRHSLQVAGASPDGVVSYDRVRYRRPVVLMLGEERAGLSDDQRALCDEIVRIPMVADTDSLNLAVAGSLLLYEILRST